MGKLQPGGGQVPPPNPALNRPAPQATTGTTESRTDQAPSVKQNAAPAAPQAFTVGPLSSAKDKKPKKQAAAPKEPRLKDQAWFDKYFSRKMEDVIQVRNYPDRKRGFHCASCGIAGSHSVIIKGKDGQGSSIDIMTVDANKVQVVESTIRGFEVGRTCLEKYGHIKLSDFAAKTPMKDEPKLA